MRSYIPSVAGQTAPVTGCVSAQGIECNGRRGYVPLTGDETKFWGQLTPTKWNYYFTSCETTLLIGAIAVTSVTAGFLMGASVVAAPALPLFAWVMSLGIIYLETLQQLSDINAIGVASRYSLVFGIAQ